MSWGLHGDLGVGMASDGAGASVRSVALNRTVRVKVFRTPGIYVLRTKWTKTQNENLYFNVSDFNTISSRRTPGFLFRGHYECAENKTEQHAKNIRNQCSQNKGKKSQDNNQIICLGMVAQLTYSSGTWKTEARASWIQSHHHPHIEVQYSLNSWNPDLVGYKTK